MKRSADWSLYLVTDQRLCGDRSLESVVAQAIDGGITALQVREKHCSTREFIKGAEKLLKLTAQAGIPLIINDRVDIAQAIGADGVHLGQNDMPYEMARAILGPKAIIGLTVSNVDEARAVAAWDISYLGVGPVFETTTKENPKIPIGIAGLKAVIESSPHSVVAIGGIKMEGVAPIINSGAAGVAVVSSIFSAEDPREAAKELFNRIQQSRTQIELI